MEVHDNHQNKHKRRYSKVEKADYVKKWQASQLSKAEFCRREDIHESCFYAWTSPAKMNAMHAKTSAPLKPAKLLSHPQATESKTASKQSQTSQQTQVIVELGHDIRLRLMLPDSLCSVAALVRELTCN